MRTKSRVVSECKQYSPELIPEAAAVPRIALQTQSKMNVLTAIMS